jgi:hypothetical protein
MDRRLRIDLTEQLTHWFKPLATDLRTEFAEAIATRTVRGAKPPYVIGPYACVAFSEVPLALAAKLLPTAQDFGINYAPVGFAFDRTWLFEQGARPVIYQSAAEAELLPIAQRYRHVTLDIERGIDFTWKREWRLPADQLRIDPRYCHTIVPTYDWKRQLEEAHSADDSVAALVAKMVVLEALV